MNQKTSKSLILGLGAIWGIIEASIGWLLHLLHMPGKGYILFSIGLCIMLYGVYSTQKKSASVYIAAIAALIKLSNLGLPGIFPAYFVINPAVSILLEGLLVYAFSSIILKNKDLFKSRWLQYGFISISIALVVNIIYAGWQWGMSEYTTHNPVITNGLTFDYLTSIWTRSLIQGLLLVSFAFALKPSHVSVRRFSISWTGSISLVVLAIVLNYITL